MDRCPQTYRSRRYVCDERRLERKQEKDVTNETLVEKANLVTIRFQQNINYLR